MSSRPHGKTAEWLARLNRRRPLGKSPSTALILAIKALIDAGMTYRVPALDKLRQPRMRLVDLGAPLRGLARINL